MNELERVEERILALKLKTLAMKYINRSLAAFADEATARFGPPRPGLGALVMAAWAHTIEHLDERHQELRREEPAFKAAFDAIAEAWTETQQQFTPNQQERSA
jgi:hypothetical protein